MHMKISSLHLYLSIKSSDVKTQPSLPVIPVYISLPFTTGNYMCCDQLLVARGISPSQPMYTAESALTLTAHTVQAGLLTYGSSRRTAFPVSQ